MALELTFARLFGKLWPYLRVHRRQVVMSLVLVLSYVVVGRALPFLFGYAIDEGLKNHDQNLILIIAGIYLALEIMRAYLSFAQNNHIQKFGNLVLFEMRENLISHTQDLPLSYFEKKPFGAHGHPRD